MGPQRGCPAVSVILPLYNGERYVANAIESVLAQTMRDLELIVLDDGSTDGGVAIVEAFAAEDLRVRLIRQPNAGLSAARNAALAQARRHAVAFIDDDDLWLPCKLEIQLPCLTEKTLVYGAEHKIWENDPGRPATLEKAVDQIGDRDPLRCLLRVNSVHGPNTVILSRSLLLRHGG